MSDHWFLYFAGAGNIRRLRYNHRTVRWNRTRHRMCRISTQCYVRVPQRHCALNSPSY